LWTEKYPFQETWRSEFSGAEVIAFSWRPETAFFCGLKKSPFHDHLK
jgi:hypothetical protein